MGNITYRDDPNGGAVTAPAVEEIVTLGALPPGNPSGYDLVRVGNQLFYFDTASSTWVQAS